MLDTLLRIGRRPKRTGSGLVVLVALVVSGCAGSTAPKPQTFLASQRPVEIPPTWQEPVPPEAEDEPEAAQIAVWWQQLDDPVLDRLVELALANNLDLQTAAARLAEARARRGLARADLGPSSSLTLESRVRDPLGEGASTDSLVAGLTTTWEADLFGAKRAALAASNADLAATTEQLHAAQVSLVAEVVVAYTDLRVAEARLRVIDASLASRDATYQLTRVRQQAGLASQLESDQALTSREQTRASRSTFERSAQGARLRLALLAGQLPGALDTVLDASPSETAAWAEASAVPKPPEAITVGLPASALQRRPDVRAAEHQLAASLARLHGAEAARYPTLRLTGSLDTQSSDLEDLFDADAWIANLLAGLTAPLFESGRIEQNVRIEQARVEQEALAYRDQVLQALSEVEAALVSLHRVGEQLTALDGALGAAQQAAMLADQRYAAGLVDLLVVLDSQRTWLAVHEQHVVAQGERALAFSDLYRALGGGWPPADPQGAPNV